MVSRNLRFRFTLVSYNILSQTLLNDHHYLYNACNPRDLEWPGRGHKIVKELLNNQADIICLQEVESDHLRSLYRPKLAHYGYECLYKKKTGYKMDGCAIFYKRKLFHLLNHKGVEFNRTDVAHLLDRDNVGIIAVLKPRIQTKSESSHLIIANTHLIFNPKRSDIKLAQLKFFLSELEKLSMQSYCQMSDSCQPAGTDSSQQTANNRSMAERRQHCQHPTILCGDLNSVPNSEVSRYIMKNTMKTPKCSQEQTQTDSTAAAAAAMTDERLGQQVAQSPKDENASPAEESSNEVIQETSQTLAEPLVDNTISDYDHPMKFKSVFPTHNRQGQKYVSTFSGEIVDYIFYTPKLRLESYKELLTEQQLRELGPIPNAEFPSDHITLGAQFVLK